MISQSTDIRAALKSRQRGFFTMPGGMGAARPSGGGGGGGIYFDEVMSDSPLAYWRLDETSGTVAADVSGNTRTATYSANASTLTTPGLLTTSSNRAILLPGTPSSNPNGFVRDNSFLNTSTVWTFECWLKLGAIPVSGGICSFWQALDAPSVGNSAPELDAIDQGGGLFKFRVMKTGVAQLFLSPTSYSYGARLYVVLRHTGTVTALFVNSVASGSASNTYGASTGRAMSFGHSRFTSSTNYYPMNGVLDEVAIYQTALSDARILSHFQAG